MGDLPDYQLQTSEVEVEAYSLRGGADSSKPASPTAKDVYIATDTKILYICVADGAWTGFDASILVQGILTLYENLAGGGKKLTNIGAPTASTDGARKAEVDTVDAKLDDVSVDDPTRVKDTIYQNTSGKIRLVVVCIDCDSGEDTKAKIGSASPPTTVVGDSTRGSHAGLVTFVFIVPDDWYYQVTEETATIMIEDWTEYDLF